MPKPLPSIKPKEFTRALERLGFVFRRQTGSHAIYRHPTTKVMASVPMHARDLKKGLVFGILKQAGISTEELLKALK